jgi:thiol-disulfide isomerase/thioredoxin
MSRFVLLALCCLSFWWVACQNTTSHSEYGGNPAGGTNPYTLHVLGMVSAEDPTPDARITITVQGLASGTAKMIGVSGDQNYIIDTTLVDGSGRMVFQRATPYPAGFYYVLLPDYTNIQMLLDANQRFSLSTVQASLIMEMKVEGSLENELLYGNLKFQQPLDNQMKIWATQQKNRGADTPEFQDLQKKIDSLTTVRKEHILGFAKSHPKAFFTKFKLSGQNPDLQQPKNEDGSLNIPLQTWLYREGLWENVDFSDMRLLRTPIVHNKLTRYIKDLTLQHPDSIIFSADRLLAKVADYPEYFKFFANFVPLTYRPGESSLMDAEAVQVHMVKNYFTKEKAFWSTDEDLAKLAKQASEMEASLLGRKGPDVQAMDTNGKMRSIYEMTSPYIVVFMWNPECSHCKEETPQLIQLLKEWKPKGLDVYGIAVNTTEAEFKRVAKEYGMTWNNVFDPTNRAIYAKYYVDNTPEIYVLNPDRIIIGKNLKASQIATVVERDMEKRK